MLVLTRKIGQKIIINDNIEISVVDVRGDTVKLGIEAPKDVRIYREELLNEVRAQNEAAKATSNEQLDQLLPFSNTKPSAQLDALSPQVND